MTAEKTYLNKLTPTTKAYKVKVKLKEKSRPLISPQKKACYQQLLFEDEKGNIMRGALFENQIEEFESVLKPNHEYEIANVPLKPVLGRYATRSDDCQMSFGGQISIQPVDPEAKVAPPSYIPIAAIPHTNDPTDRIDVLGIVVFVEDTRIITTSYRTEHSVREIVILDHRTEQPMTISVWDDLTGAECNSLKSWAGPSLIVGFTSLKPSTHKGFSLATTMATVFFRNPDGERADALRKWAAENRKLIAERMTRIAEVRKQFEQINIITIAAIKRKKAESTLQEEKHWIKVIVHEPDRSKIVPDVGCKNCGKHTETECGMTYTCEFCNKDNCVETPRITFKFDATDETHQMTFTAFTEECESLFNLTSAEIYAQIKAGTFDFETIIHVLSTRYFLMKIGPSTSLARNKILSWIPKAICWSTSADSST